MQQNEEVVPTFVPDAVTTDPGRTPAEEPGPVQQMLDMEQAARIAIAWNHQDV